MGERKRGEKESSSAIPVSASSSDDAYIPKVYPSPSHINVDERDSRDGMSFVSLFDAKNTEYLQRRRSDYRFRRCAVSRKYKSHIIKQSKQAASLGYFLNDIEPY